MSLFTIPLSCPNKMKVKSRHKFGIFGVTITGMLTLRPWSFACVPSAFSQKPHKKDERTEGRKKEGWKKKETPITERGDMDKVVTEEGTKARPSIQPNMGTLRFSTLQFKYLRILPKTNL